MHRPFLTVVVSGSGVGVGVGGGLGVGMGLPSLSTVLMVVMSGKGPA